MTVSMPGLTRRGALAALGAAALAPPALAAPAVSYPMRIAYARVSPQGFAHIRSDEQQHWTRMATRLGGLVDVLAPMQPANMLGGGLPKISEGASCALAARRMAADAGYGHVILYATHDGQHIQQTYDNWFAETFAQMTQNLGKDGRATGEAHLLDVTGGMPLASAHADAAPRDLLNLFDGGRNPEREALTGLVSAMEQQLQHMARPTYENQRSIAD